MTPVIPTCDLRSLECAARPSSLKLTCCYLEARALLLTMCPSAPVRSNGSGGSRVECRKPTTAVFANSSGPFVWGGTTRKIPGSGGGGQLHDDILPRSASFRFIPHQLLHDIGTSFLSLGILSACPTVTVDPLGEERSPQARADVPSGQEQAVQGRRVVLHGDPRSIRGEPF